LYADLHSFKHRFRNDIEESCANSIILKLRVLRKKKCHVEEFLIRPNERITLKVLRIVEKSYYICVRRITHQNKAKSE
jgi:hypothetical protein